MSHAEVIHDDTICSNCEYALRSLRLDGNCPECGQPVATSLKSVSDRELLAREDRLIEAAEVYRRRRRTAIRLGIWTIAISLLLNFALSLSPLASSPVANVVILVLVGGFFVGLMFMFASRVYKARLDHIEYVLDCRRGGDISRDHTKRRQDDRILNRKNHFERDVDASGCLLGLAILGVIGFLVLLMMFPRIPPLPTIFMIIAGFLHIPYWLMLLAYKKARLHYAESIEYYRRQATENRAERGPTLSEESQNPVGDE